MSEGLKNRIEEIAQSPDELSDQERKDLHLLVESWLSHDSTAVYTSILQTLFTLWSEEGLDDWIWSIFQLTTRLSDPNVEIDIQELIPKIVEAMNWENFWEEHIVLLELLMLLENQSKSPQESLDLKVLLDWKIESWFDQRLESWMSSLRSQDWSIVNQVKKKFKTWWGKSQTVVWTWIRSQFGSEKPIAESYTRVRHSRDISDDLQVTAEWEYTRALGWDWVDIFGEPEKKEDKIETTFWVNSDKRWKLSAWYATSEKWEVITVAWNTAPIKIGDKTTVTASWSQTINKRENFEWEISKDIQTTAKVRAKTSFWKAKVNADLKYTRSDRITWDPMSDRRSQMLWWTVEYRKWRNSFNVWWEIPVWPHADQQRRWARVNASTRYQVTGGKKWKPTVNIHGTVSAQQWKDWDWNTSREWQWEAGVEVKF